MSQKQQYFNSDHIGGICPSAQGCSALVLSGEFCIATGACPDEGIAGSTLGTMTGYEIVDRSIHLCVLCCLIYWLYFYCCVTLLAW